MSGQMNQGFNRNERRKVNRELTRIPEGGAEIAFWYKVVILGPIAREVIRQICLSEQAETYHVSDSKMLNKYAVPEDEEIDFTRANGVNPDLSSTDPIARLRGSPKKNVCKIYCPVNTKIFPGEKTTSQSSISTKDAFSLGEDLTPSTLDFKPSRTHERLARVELVPVEGFSDDMPCVRPEYHLTTAILRLITQDSTPSDIKRVTSEIRCAQQSLRGRELVQVAAMIGSNIGDKIRSTLALVDEIKIIECPDQDGDALFDIVQGIAQEMFENTGNQSSASMYSLGGSPSFLGSIMPRSRYRRCGCDIM